MFIVDLQYRTPHFHRDIEVGIMLDGELDLIRPDGTDTMKTGDFFVTNPFQPHELSGRYPARLLVLQIPVSYFKHLYPQIKTTEFTRLVYHCSQESELCALMHAHLLSIGRDYFRQEPLQGLVCAAGINRLFYDLLTKCPTRAISEEERQREARHGQRMRRLVDYIDAHHEEKIRLSDFAEEEGLDLYYLSHSFKDYFGISFQEYVMRTRCEHASNLLLNTNYSLLDISISCGFSDPKYMKKGFLQQYGCTPKEYRKIFHVDTKRTTPEETITTQNIMSPEICLVLLESKYVS